MVQRKPINNIFTDEDKNAALGTKIAKIESPEDQIKEFEPDGGGQMYKQQEEQLHKISQWLEKERESIFSESGNLMGRGMYDRLMERIHGEFYCENALWNADSDYIGVIVERFLEH